VACRAKRGPGISSGMAWHGMNFLYAGLVWEVITLPWPLAKATTVPRYIRHRVITTVKTRYNGWSVASIVFCNNEYSVITSG
jgi:hypothetical protein